MKITPQQPPKKKGMPLWGILSLSIGGVILVSCVLCASLYALAPKQPGTSLAKATNTPAVVTATAATVTLDAPINIQIGSRLGTDSNNQPTIIEPKTSFHGHESMAWVYSRLQVIDVAHDPYVWKWQVTDYKHFFEGERITNNPVGYEISASYPDLSSFLPAQQGKYCVIMYYAATITGKACFFYTP